MNYHKFTNFYYCVSNATRIPHRYFLAQHELVLQSCGRQRWIRCVCQLCIRRREWCRRLPLKNTVFLTKMTFIECFIYLYGISSFNFIPVAFFNVLFFIASMGIVHGIIELIFWVILKCAKINSKICHTVGTVLRCVPDDRRRKCHPPKFRLLRNHPSIQLSRRQERRRMHKRP